MVRKDTKWNKICDIIYNDRKGEKNEKSYIKTIT